MDYERIYKMYVRSAFSDKCHSIVRAIIYIQNNFYNMPIEFQNACKELSNETQNKIIQTILWEDEFAKEYKLRRI